MELDEDNKALQVVADGEFFDYQLWPALLPRVIKRIEQIAHNEFPPRKPGPTKTILPSSSESILQIRPEASQAPVVTDTPMTNTQHTNQEIQPLTTPEQATAEQATAESIPSPISSPPLPLHIKGLISSITQTLEAYFSTKPPHTIQRLAELLLTPRKHYRTLSSYLHALDRVVHVTSGANTYPLPAAIPDAAGLKILSNGSSTVAGVDPETISWGTSTTKDPTLGSDESLGGALLTPIPWLRNPSSMSLNSFRSGRTSPNKEGGLEGEVKTESTETIDGPNGAGSVETVSISVNGVSSHTLGRTPALSSSPVLNGNGDLASGLRAEGGVTQGELLRQEQKAGVVPAAQLSGGLSRGGIDGEEEDAESPHARGPEEIGASDLGPQESSSISGLHGMQGIDVEAAVGRRGDGIAPNDAETSSETERKEDTVVEMLTTPTKREAEEDIDRESKRTKEDGVDSELGESKGDALSDVENNLEKGDVAKEEEMLDTADREIELVDADGRTEKEAKFGDMGETRGADASDTTAL